MTTPPNGATTSPPPAITRVVSNPIFSDRDEPITWAVRMPHPIIDTYVVVRMFADLGGVEIYSLSTDGKSGMRNIIPASKIRLTEEAMPPDVFREELEAAMYAGAPVGPLSADDDDDGDDEPEEPEETETPTADPS